MDREKLEREQKKRSIIVIIIIMFFGGFQRETASVKDLWISSVVNFFLVFVERKARKRIEKMIGLKDLWEEC